MATIITKNSTTPGNIPGTIVQGELAINTADGKLFYGSGSVAKEFTASLATTASYVTGSIFNSTNPALSASYALTASYAFNSVPGDGNTTIQFNDAGAFSGSGNFTFTKATNTVKLSGSLNLTGSLLATQSFISKVQYIDYELLTTAPAFSEGRLHWSDDTKTIEIDTDVNGFEIEVGHVNVVRVVNKTGGPLAAGKVVFISGSQGNRPTVVTASWDGDMASATTLGFVAQTINDNNNGYVVTNGLLRNINTNAYPAGTQLYLSSSGDWTSTIPVSPKHEVRLGKVITQNATTGIIYVDVMNGYELGELHDVVDSTTTSSFGDLLVKSGSVWINTKQLTGSYAITGSLEATSFTGSLQGTASWAISASQAITASYVAPAGSNFQIQYNNNGTLGATGSFRFDYNSQSLEQGDNVLASGLYSHAEGILSTASGQWSHAEGFSSKATAFWSHAEGLSIASGIYSHAEGNNTQASGQGAHSEGDATLASGLGSHAEGGGTKALNTGAHSEGRLTSASGFFSHAEGENTKATGQSSHAEGRGTETISNFSHAEGSGSITRGIASHAEGWGTVTSGSFQHVQGQFNLSSSAQSAFIIGNGTSDSNRSNLVFASGSTFQITGSLEVSGSITGVTLVGTASWAQSASNAINAQTASFLPVGTYNITSSWATNALTASFISLLRATGSNLAIQFNNGGFLGANSNFTYNTASNTVIIDTNLIVTDKLSTTTRQLIDSGRFISLDWENRQGIYSDGTTATLDWNSLQLYVEDSSLSVDWGKRVLVDIFDSSSIDWKTRTLKAPDGTSTVLSWNNTTGSLIGTSSWAVSSSQAVSSSFATTASYVIGGGGSTVKAGSGSVASFGGSPLTSSITFGSAFSNNSYAVTVTGEDARSWTIQSKTSAGFTINSNSSVGLTGPVYWMATPFGS